MINYEDIQVGDIVRLVLPKGYIGVVTGKERSPDPLVFVEYWKGPSRMMATYPLNDVELLEELE